MNLRLILPQPGLRRPSCSGGLGLFAFCVGLILLGWLVQAADRDHRGIRVLVVTGMDHPAHDWRTVSAAVQDVLTRDPRIQVEILTDPYRLDTTDLSRFQTVFLNFNNWQQPDPGDAAKAGLRKFVHGGGGLFVLHFACGAFANWPEFPDLAGRVYDRTNTHDPRGPFTVTLIETNHPITRTLRSFETDDELYTCLTGKAPIQLLATARSKVTLRDEPMAFLHRFGSGRVFHTPLGHDARAVRNPGTAELIRRGCLWSAGIDGENFDRIGR